MSIQVSLFRGALLAIIVAVGWRYIQYREVPCSTGTSTNSSVEDGTVLSVLSVFGPVDPCACFSETYEEARSKFRKAASEAGFELFTLEIYKNYTTDVAFLGFVSDGLEHEHASRTNSSTSPSASASPYGTGRASSGRDLVVHTSGVHGVEGYAGSAIQIAFLKNFRHTSITNPSQFPSIMLIHAINPYGMAHYRRVNENNVDLNRNGMHDFSQAIHQDPNLAGYVDFDHVFNPEKPFRFGFVMVLIRNVLQHGLAKLKTALVTGQYHKPSGLTYGGTHLEASNQKLYDFCKQFIATLAPLGKTTWVNVHTGLGRYGKDTILLQSGAPATLRRAVANVFNESLIPGATGGDDVHQGYHFMKGGTEDLMRPLFGSPDDWNVVQEFGTHSSITVGRALILENMFHNHFRKPSQLLRDAFYPGTPKWRSSILVRGLRVLKQAMGR